MYIIPFDDTHKPLLTDDFQAIHERYARTDRGWWHAFQVMAKYKNNRTLKQMIQDLNNPMDGEALEDPITPYLVHSVIGHASDPSIVVSDKIKFQKKSTMNVIRRKFKDGSLGDIEYIGYKWDKEEVRKAKNRLHEVLIDKNGKLKYQTERGGTYNMWSGGARNLSEAPIINVGDMEQVQYFWELRYAFLCQIEKNSDTVFALTNPLVTDTASPYYHTLHENGYDLPLPYNQSNISLMSVMLYGMDLGKCTNLCLKFKDPRDVLAQELSGTTWGKTG